MTIELSASARGKLGDSVERLRVATLNNDLAAITQALCVYASRLAEEHGELDAGRALAKAADKALLTVDETLARQVKLRPYSQ